jgi:hypothetical protein
MLQGIAGSKERAMSRELALQIPEEGADAGCLVALTGYLRAEFLQLDVASVAMSRSGELTDRK